MTKSGLAQRDLILPNIGEDLPDARRYRANKELAYTEGFDEFVKTSVPVTLNGKHYKAHPNINLYIDIAEICNADCEWCIAKVNFKRIPRPNPQITNQIAAALSVCKSANPSIQVTGGEPTLFPRTLTEVATLFKKIQPKRPVLNTNGVNLLQCSNSVHTFQHINISRHHYNEVDNARIMRVKSHTMTNSMLSTAISPIKSKVRLQCNFLYGEVDTYGEVMQMIAFAYHKLGIRNLVFAQLTPLPSDSFYDLAIINCIKKAPVDVDTILDRVEQDTRFIFEKYRGGVACYYEVWKFTAYEKPMTIVFKYSNNYWLEKADNDPQLLPDLILHTDGTLTGSWSKERKVIMHL